MSKTITRDAAGRFCKGTKPGPGRPALVVSVNEIKRTVFETVGPEDVRAVVQKVTDEAKGGKPWACRLFCDLLLGRPDHKFDPRAVQPDGEQQQRQGPQYTAQERLVLARAMMRDAERELRGQEAIDVEGEEVRDE